MKNTISVEDSIKTLLKKSHYIYPSFESYGSPSGFQTYGVLGTGLKRRVIDLWRKIFCPMNSPDDEISIYEIDTPIVGPEKLYIASGHVDRFTDPVAKDKDGRIERVDHYIKARIKIDKTMSDDDKESMINSLDNLTNEQLQDALTKYAEPDRQFNEIYDQNLMLSTSTNLMNTTSYLRPETAQGLITEFKNIYKFNGESLPFGISQIGRVYRKEIRTTPFTRLTEFEQAEIEVFNDPTKPITLSDIILNTKINVFSNNDQESGTRYDYDTSKRCLKDMINCGLNTIIALFMYKISQFMQTLGIDPKRIRFRQHLKNELAHYSSDCWDMEYLIRDKSIILNEVDPSESYWIEVIGIADRGCYDLTQHGPVRIKRIIDPPEIRIVIKPTFNPKTFYKTFKQDSNILKTYIENLCQEDPLFVDKLIFNNSNNLATSLTFDNKTFNIDSSLVTVSKSKELVSSEEFVPHIIEPSIGVDRLIYAILNSRYWVRPEDSDRCVMSLSSIIAPIQVVILPLLTKPIITKHIGSVVNMVSKITSYYKVDSSGASIGKKYSRSDEIGIPYAITIDYQTDNDLTVTIRNRDDTTQIRVKIDDLAKHLSF